MNMDYLIQAFKQTLDGYHIEYELTSNENKTQYTLIMMNLPKSIDSLLMRRKIISSVFGLGNDKVVKPEKQKLCDEGAASVGIIKIDMNRSNLCQKMNAIDCIIRKHFKSK